MSFQVTVEWSGRSRALQSRLRQKAPGVSFWLQPGRPPVRFGFVAPQDVGGWATAGTTPLSVATDLATQSATVTIPDGLAHVRLDFDLEATAGGHTSTVLSFRQLFLASPAPPGPVPSPAGTLTPSQFSLEDIVLVPTSNGPVRMKGPSPTGRRTEVGLHPLLSLAAAGRYSVNAEFVDATHLWWKVHPDTVWGWYWRRELQGRQEHLRVLAWTGGGNPMIWFAAVPDAAVEAPKKDAAARKDGPAEKGESPRPRRRPRPRRTSYSAARPPEVTRSRIPPPRRGSRLRSTTTSPWSTSPGTCSARLRRLRTGRCNRRGSELPNC